MKKVHGSSQPTTQHGYDEMNLDIHSMRLNSKDTNHGNENPMNSSLSPVKDLTLELNGPFHGDSFNEFLENFDSHNSTSGTSVFGK